MLLLQTSLALSTKMTTRRECEDKEEVKIASRFEEIRVEYVGAEKLPASWGRGNAARCFASEKPAVELR